MPVRKDVTQKDFQDTLSNLEFASKKAKLLHIIELKSRQRALSNGQDRERLGVEIESIRAQIRKMENDRGKTV